MNRITEKTLIPISLVITILSGTIWITVLAQDTKANTGSIGKVEFRQDRIEREVIDTQKEMIKELSSIKADLRFIKEKVK